ncbi:hypothetical protein HG535_0A07600 [Zygotorulaspora mrakii]|uniref:ATP-dependent RNA helicase n=1 Tax=Zygotorulaspora mrakii TaxID=42260 RepID=A0A7H9AWN0_ZYGMR|nr:uncharacterized protein HG535_0A07600 [Zygotorulaspora mrakii]QLG70818.1 hypothetical protein HG535_0A07600 [Zygotorulaspora mrakii]
MFAVRFDPNQVFEATPQEQNETGAIIPLKRAKSVEDDEDDDGEDNGDKDDNEDIEMKNANDKDIKHETADKHEFEDANADSSGEDDSSDEENRSDDQSVGSGEAFELKGSLGTNLNKSHSSVLSRFQKSMKLRDTREVADDSTNNDAAVVDEGTHQVLEHIPQPPIVRSTNFSESNDHKSIAWLHTTKVYYDNSMSKPFDSYSSELEPNLLSNIKRQFAGDTFPIQTVLLNNILPVLNFSLQTTRKNLTRRVGDILVNASTGSGKTLGYAIPIVQLLSKRNVNKLRALIILPTKLLINQVYETIRKLSQGTGLIISMSKLDCSLKEEHTKFLQNEPDILVTTPGRLVDHLNMSSLSLKNLSILVLDEADHLLNQSFQNWCPELMNRIKMDKNDNMPGNVIKMIFSATLTTNTEKLHGLQLYNPKLFVMDSVKLYNLPSTLQEYNIGIPTAKSIFKPLILLYLLDRLNNSKILVFVKSNEASLRLASLLNIMIGEKLGKQHIITSVNSNNTKSENRKLVNDFAVSASYSSANKVLITTDLMSRGIDINDITDVINYDLPIGSQQYVHRCGRTARARTEGNAFNLLVGKGEKTFWCQSIDNDMSRDVNGCVPRDWDSSNPEGDQETQEALPLSKISSDEEKLYKKCLEILKQKASSK